MSSHMRFGRCTAAVLMTLVATVVLPASALARETDTTTAVTSSQNPSVAGQPVTFTATVTTTGGTGTPTGSVSFMDGSSVIGTGTLFGGVATITTSSLATGNHTISARYAGSGPIKGSTGSMTGNPQVVTGLPTATAVASSQNPSVAGHSVTFTATVTPTSGSGTPTGTVTFLDGGSQIGTGTLINGIASFTTSALSVGSHTITTSYGGDSTFAGGTGSLTGNPQVITAIATTTTVASSQNPSVVGQSVTFTATVTPTSGSGTPTGTVTFLDGGSQIGTGTLTNGVASFATSALNVGSHTITTSYGGDSTFTGGTGSLTGNPQVVNQATSAISTAVFDAANGDPWSAAETAGASAYDTATVTGNGITPTGTVSYSFFANGSCVGAAAAIDQVSLVGGAAPSSSATGPLQAGSYSFQAAYSGDGDYTSSVSACEPFAVSAPSPGVTKPSPPPTTTVSSSSPSAPICTLSPKTNKVFVRAHTRRNRARVGLLRVRVTCDQLAKVSLAAVVTEHTRHNHLTAFTLRAVGAQVRPGIATVLSLKLPGRALTALGHRHRESVAITLTATNANGTSSVTLTISKLRRIP